MALRDQRLVVLNLRILIFFKLEYNFIRTKLNSHLSNFVIIFIKFYELI